MLKADEMEYCFFSHFHKKSYFTIDIEFGPEKYTYIKSKLFYKKMICGSLKRKHFFMK